MGCGWGLLVLENGRKMVRAVHTQVPADAATLACTPVTAKQASQPEHIAGAVCAFQRERCGGGRARGKGKYLRTQATYSAAGFQSKCAHTPWQSGGKETIFEAGLEPAISS